MKISEVLNENAVGIPRKVYHVTPTRNLPSIKQNGLVPSIGDRSSQVTGESNGIFCFPSKAHVEDALMNWLGDEFDEDERLSLLLINTDGLHGQFTPNAEYEIVITDVVPPSNIRVLTKDVDSFLMEASGYIPSESEKNDPRFKTALSVDVHPDTMKRQAKAMGLGKIERTGVPQQANPNGKFTI